jgi:hypothetical protein
MRSAERRISEAIKNRPVFEPELRAFMKNERKAEHDERIKRRVSKVG